MTCDGLIFPGCLPAFGDNSNYWLSPMAPPALGLVGRVYKTESFAASLSKVAN